jgi:hypothetical protein
VNLLKLFFFEGSRKVAFGLWLFAIANVFLIRQFIKSDEWMTCVIFSSVLVGGGTVADSWLRLKGQGKRPEIPGDKQ